MFDEIMSRFEENSQLSARFELTVFKLIVSDLY